MYYREEAEIDLIELVHYILVRWRQIVVCMLVIGIMGGAYGVYKQKEPIARTSDVKEAALDALKENLNDSEIDEVSAMVDLYDSYQKVYDDTVKLGERSIFLKLDPEHVNQGKVTYIISDFYDNRGIYTVESQDAGNIVSLYRERLTNDESIELVKNATGWKTDNQFVKELIYVGGEGVSLLKINVTAGSADDCRKILTILEQRLDDVKDEVKADADHKIEMIGETFTEEYSKEVNDARKKQNEALVSINNSIRDLPLKLSSGQKALYDEIIKQKNNDYYKPRRFSKTSVIKFIILGMFGGAFLVACWYAILYIIRQRLRTREEFSDMFGVNVFGIVKVHTDKKKRLFSIIDRFLEKCYDNRNGVLPEGKAIDMIASEIAISIDKNSIKTPYIISSIDDAVVEGVIKQLTSTGLEDLLSCSSILTDPNALKKFSGADGVIVVEKLYQSKLSDIAREIEISKEYGVNVLGSVIVQ